VTTSVESYSDSVAVLLERASVPGTDLNQIIAIADRQRLATGNEEWAMPRAFALWQLKRPEEAMAAIDLAQTVCSEDSNFQMLRGVIARQLPDKRGNSIAMQAYRHAIRLSPNRDDAYYCLANLLSDAEEIADAEAMYRRCLELNPKQSLAWHNLGRMMCFDDRHEQALPLLRQSLILDPLFADGWCNLGLGWLGLKEYDRALNCFYQAIALDETHGPTHINIGNALISKLQPDEALLHLERGAQLENSSANSLWNLSLCYLLMGRFREGWRYYETRFQTDMFAKAPIPTCGPRLTNFSQLPKPGEPPLVVFAEQGMGDSIQFFRYLYLLESLHVPFEFHSRGKLLRLFQEWSPFAERIVEERSSEPAQDPRPHIPLMSLPMVFGTEADTIPSSVPFLVRKMPTPDHLRFETPPGGLSVGVVWASNPDNKAMYKNKSLPLAVLMPCLLQLINLDLIHLHSLQFGEDANQLSPWSSHEGITIWKDRLSDFSETAHVIQQLDLVISVDTAVAHLAGALNIPTWLLLPDNADFRWLRDINSCPWYPSMRLFRQSQKGDWVGLVAEVQKAFGEMTLLNLDKIQNVA
jgi:tetratricopeptide (TPR) repeat protein